MWTQSLTEVVLHVPVHFGTRAKDVTVEISPTRLKLGLKGQQPIIDGELFKPTLKDSSFWQLEDKQNVVVYLTKQNGMEWWASAIKGDGQIDITKIDTNHPSDLDDTQRATVRQIIQDPNAPNSEERKKLEMVSI